MHRVRTLSVIPLCLLLVACPSYDRDTPVADQDGLVPADRFAAYGAEQAQAMAIGRALAAADAGTSVEAKARQVTNAAEYARSLPDVVDVTPDTAARMLTVRFRSGWRKGVIPIPDGVPPDATPGLPPRQ